MNILMVCLGNICRSPLAEGILEHKIIQKNLSHTVDSAGTASFHVGESPDYRSQKVAKAHGINISKQKGRHFTVKDFKHFDYIFVMDSSNYRNVISLAKNEEDKNKVVLILNVLYPNENLSVPDPYHGGDEGFEKVYQMLDLACDKIIEKYLL